jgi:hypothetical protein
MSANIIFGYLLAFAAVGLFVWFFKKLTNTQLKL